MNFSIEQLSAAISQYVPVHNFLGIELVEIKPLTVKFHLPFRPELIGDPRADRWHGGVVALLLDSAGGAASMTTLNNINDKLATIDMRVDYLKPGLGGKDIWAEAQVTKNGSRVVVTHMEAWHEIDGEKLLIAEGRGAYSAVREPINQD
ncbi:MAG: hotdog fold thioesterase [Bacteroidota bacterium]